jgi:hypothetical protein
MYKFEDALHLVDAQLPASTDEIKIAMAKYIIKVMNIQDESPERILMREWPTDWYENL